MKLPLFQVDAFTDKLFSGNPAAVCPLENWLAAQQMQAIAAENHLSETAFFVLEGNDFELRWFSPTFEVQLCGHATLASAFVIFNFLRKGSEFVRFRTCSGPLEVRQDSGSLAMDFPAYPVKPSPNTPQQLLEGLYPRPETVLESGESASERNYFVIYKSEGDVRNAQPNFTKLAELHPAGVCITAPGRDVDFVSRYFVPSYGIPEDPVTGSTHCSLGPYWAERLNKSPLHARQLSARGGELWVEPKGPRVTLKGKAALYMQGSLLMESA